MVGNQKSGRAGRIGSTSGAKKNRMLVVMVGNGKSGQAGELVSRRSKGKQNAGCHGQQWEVQPSWRGSLLLLSNLVVITVDVTVVRFLEILSRCNLLCACLLL